MCGISKTKGEKGNVMPQIPMLLGSRKVPLFGIGIRAQFLLFFSSSFLAEGIIIFAFTYETKKTERKPSNRSWKKFKTYVTKSETITRTEKEIRKKKCSLSGPNFFSAQKSLLLKGKQFTSSFICRGAEITLPGSWRNVIPGADYSCM